VNVDYYLNYCDELHNNIDALISSKFKM